MPPLPSFALLAIAAGCLLLAEGVAANGSFAAKAAIVERIDDAVDLMLADDSVDGCALREQPLAGAAEASLRRNGMSVDERSDTRIVIGIQGFRAASKAGEELGCVSSVQVEVIQNIGVGVALVYTYSDLMISDGDNTAYAQQAVEHAIQDFARKLAREREEAAAPEPESETL